MNPWWYMWDFGHQVTVGGHEEESFSPFLATDLFQAKAMVLGQSFGELAARLAWVFENYGPKDIYRLQNLVALIHAGE